MATQPNQDPAAVWRKSRASSGDSECVEVAKWEAFVLVRDSGDQSGVILEFSPAQWRRFVSQVKNTNAAPG